MRQSTNSHCFGFLLKAPFLIVKPDSFNHSSTTVQCLRIPWGELCSRCRNGCLLLAPWEPCSTTWPLKASSSHWGFSNPMLCCQQSCLFRKFLNYPRYCWLESFQQCIFFSEKKKKKKASLSKRELWTEICWEQKEGDKEKKIIFLWESGISALVQRDWKPQPHRTSSLPAIAITSTSVQLIWQKQPGVEFPTHRIQIGSVISTAR